MNNKAIFRGFFKTLNCSLQSLGHLRFASFHSAPENAQKFPNKTYETLRVLEDGDLVAIYGKVILSQESQWSVIHILRFEDDKIIESWRLRRKYSRILQI